jgi:hypothetical protein
MKTLEVAIYWFNKIWPWVVIPTLIFASFFIGLLWGEAKKGLRS